MEEHHVIVRRSARYYTLGPLDQPVAQVWIVCHGFAQLGSRFMRNFHPLDDGTRLIVAPEALNRFYIEEGTPGVHGPQSKVGATWMTREDRLREIGDYVEYLDTLSDTIFARVDRSQVHLTVLGFSQGVATVARWVVQGRTRPDHLILWASPLPPEIDVGAGVEALANVPRLSVVVGDGDTGAQRALPDERERMRRLGLDYTLERFEGGHRIDTGALLRLAGT